MFVWQKRAGLRWLAAHEQPLREIAESRLAITLVPTNKTALAQVASASRRDLDKIRARFAGTIKRLPRDWLERLSAIQVGQRLKIGQRLVIVRPSTSSSRNNSVGLEETIGRRSMRLAIPAGAAFGTGEHVTTAMSLRLLEQLSQKFGRSWSMLDLGTGSGILALAARRLGATKVVAIDSDPVAIATAKANARLNGVRGIEFRIGDARSFSHERRFQIAAANLYSELLIEILPKLKETSWLIASGVLREQEVKFVRALKRNKFSVAQTRRRGRWIALLAQQKVI